MTYALYRSKDHGVIILRADTLMVLLEFGNSLLLKQSADVYFVAVVGGESVGVS